MFRIPPPYLWTPLSPQRVKGCTPLTIPKMRSKPKNASRFAKRIFLCFSHLRLRRRFHVSAELYRQQRGNTSCEAANRRNEKKALSEAASFFPFRQPLWGLKGASSPFLVDPARRNRWCFSGSLLARKRERILRSKPRTVENLGNFFVAVSLVLKLYRNGTAVHATLRITRHTVQHVICNTLHPVCRGFQQSTFL